MPDEKSKLTKKQLLFVHAYIANDFNATKAAMEAGYSEQTAYSIGQRLLKNVEIQAAINERVQERLRVMGVRQDRVLAELVAIGLAKMTDVIEFGSTDDADIDIFKALPKPGDDEDGAEDDDIFTPVRLKSSKTLPEETKAAIAEVTFGKGGIRIKMHDKVGALKVLAQNTGALIQTHQVQQLGKDGQPVDAPAKVIVYLPKSAPGPDDEETG